MTAVARREIVTAPLLRILLSCGGPILFVSSCLSPPKRRPSLGVKRASRQRQCGPGGGPPPPEAAGVEEDALPFFKTGEKRAGNRGRRGGRERGAASGGRRAGNAAGRRASIRFHGNDGDGRLEKQVWGGRTRGEGKAEGSLRFAGWGETGGGDG